jgi:integrase
MPIYPKRGKNGDLTYQVVVERKLASGYVRIRKTKPTSDSADKLLKDINKALDVYGKWPVNASDKPLEVSRLPLRSGTLREACDAALRTHYRGMAYEDNAGRYLEEITRFMAERKKRDIDQITSEDLDAYTSWCLNKGNCANTINKKLSVLSKTVGLALKRVPPLAKAPLPITKMKVKRVEKWWFRPEDQAKAYAWLLEEQGDQLYVDFLETMVGQGLRVMEALRLAPRHFIGLDGDKPSIIVPGTKTARSQATIPLYDDMRDWAQRSIDRAKANGWDVLFPYSWQLARNRWNEVRDCVDAGHIPTATLKALRRSFAHRANQRGVTTKDLKEVLRHSSILTTEGYLNLTGGGGSENSRERMNTSSVKKCDKNVTDLERAIEAYAATGAGPKEMAEFVKAMIA